jgi:hypothetical protein
VKRRTAILWAIVAGLAISPAAGAGDKKTKPASSSMVDSGSFGVFVKGQRVVTEHFSVEQQNDVSVIKAQLKETANPATVQKSELHITAGGELIRYEWSQESGESLTVLPNNDFLIEKITSPTSSKPAERPFLMPSTSPILDNNFFVHREILAWKYLAIAPCRDENGQRHCEPVDFGALVPQDHISMSVRMELVGKEKITLRGAERELLRLNLHGEQFDWALWVDDKDHFKLMRVLIPADNTEVVRD